MTMLNFNQSGGNNAGKLLGELLAVIASDDATKERLEAIAKANTEVTSKLIDIQKVADIDKALEEAEEAKEQAEFLQNEAAETFNKRIDSARKEAKAILAQAEAQAKEMLDEAETRQAQLEDISVKLSNKEADMVEREQEVERLVTETHKLREKLTAELQQASDAKAIYTQKKARFDEVMSEF